MLETVMKHNVIFYVMGSLMTVGILAKLVSYFTARKLVKAAGDIQKSNQKLMRLVKAKFEHASMVSDKVKNVEAFANKKNFKSQSVLEHLGLLRIGENKNGNSFYLFIWPWGWSDLCFLIRN